MKKVRLKNLFRKRIKNKFKAWKMHKIEKKLLQLLVLKIQKNNSLLKLNSIKINKINLKLH